VNWHSADFDDLDALLGEEWITVKSPRGEVRRVRRWHPFLLQMLGQGWEIVENEDESEQAGEADLS
jgi:hypothetical protein